MRTISRYGFLIGMACLMGVVGAGAEVAQAQMAPMETTAPGLTLPIAWLGVPYEMTLSGMGGIPPYRWELVQGALPNGMQFNNEGRLYGSPGSMGDYAFFVRLTDSTGETVVREVRFLVATSAIRPVAPVSPEPMVAPTPAVTTFTVPPVTTPAPPLPDGVPTFAQLPLLGSPVGGMPTLLPYGTPAATTPVPVMEPLFSAPAPTSLPIFSQPPLLGSPAGGMPSLLPYDPNAALPVAPHTSAQPASSAPVTVVGSATTSTQVELLKQLEQKGIAVHSLVRIPADPSGVNTNVTYYIGRDGRRHAFPHASVMRSWYPDGMPQTRSLTSEELQAIPLGANVTYRPGTTIVQFEGAHMYVVTGPKTLRLLSDAQAAQTIYGPNWINRLAGLSDAYFADYVLSPEATVMSSNDISPYVLEQSVHDPSDLLRL